VSCAKAVYGCFFHIFAFYEKIMRPRPSIILSLILVLLLLTTGTTAQRVFVNMPNGLLELNGPAGSCTSVPLTNECAAQFGSSTFSIAVYKDTLYYLDGSTLRSFKIGVPGSCRTYPTTIGGYNSMTVGQNGVLYFSSNQLVSYNPYTNVLTNHGTLPFGSGGDLIFFNGKLLLAGVPSGIYEINIANPMASTLYMGIGGLQFYGLMSYPVPCGNSRYFGLNPSGNGTTLYELDLVNKVVLGSVCAINNLTIYDAGSTTETGINAGITITNLQVTQPCPPANTGQISIQGVLDTFAITYTLNNTTTNTTGIFNNVPIGQHTVRLSANGCTTDTTIVIRPGLSQQVDVQKADANNCEGNNGSVTLTGSSGHPPVLYQLQGSGQQAQPNGTFNNLLPGTYQFTVNDAAGCSRNVTVTIALLPPVFVTGAQVAASRCGQNNGSIRLSLAGGDTVGVTTSVNGAAFVPQVSYANLQPGTYNIQARRGTRCFFDTTIVIADVVDPKPSLAVQITNQRCFVNNGSIIITASGAADQTFAYQLNGAGYSTVNRFDSLTPGLYQLGIRNQYGCAWDTSVVVRAYPKLPVLLNTAAINPLCEEPFGGSIRVTVSGTETPYSLQLGNRSIPSGQLITGLSDGSYTIYVQNRDGCVVDSVKQVLTVKVEPRCIVVYVPTAFTPNGDGRNDLFRPLQTYFTRNMRLQVFNRFGQAVYNGTGPNVQWDGTFKGAPQLAGSYVYWLTYTDYLGMLKKVKGNVVLIR
jgi:gliding motility-associated-like protein